MRVIRDGNRFVAVSTYEERAAPKEAGFRWEPKKKEWWTADWRTAAKLAEYCDETVRAEIQAEQRKAVESIEASRAIDAAIEVPVPEGLAYLPFQKAGIAFSMGRDATLLGDEMGLGKTIQALGVINADPTIKSVLIVCPAGLRLNWKREAEKWLVRPMKVDVAAGDYLPQTAVVVVNYDILKRHRAALRGRTWDLLVADEIHYAKSPRAIRTTELLGGKNGKGEKIEPIPARRRMYLTGTPILNRPVELWPLLHSMGGWPSWHQYVTRYCQGHETRWGWDVSGASHLDELQERLRASVMIRRLKADVLPELPAKRRQVIELPANGAGGAVKAEAEAWESRKERVSDLRAAVELAKASDSQEEYKAAVEALREGMRVAFTEMSALRHATALAKVPYVVDHVTDAVEASGKVVLFCWHKDVVAKVLAGLTEREVSSVIATGDMGTPERQASVDAFQEDGGPRVFVGTIMAAGVGITLTAAAHVIFAELDWVPGNITQAEDRLHRIGQRESVLVQHLVLEGSLDAEMARRIVRKQDVIDRALDSKIETEELGGWGTMLTEETATAEVSRAEVQKQAETVTDEEAEDLLQKLRMIAGMCDGARTRDGAGFGRYDAKIGHSLAEQPRLSAGQAVIARKLVQKYRRQLE